MSEERLRERNRVLKVQVEDARAEIRRMAGVEGCEDLDKITQLRAKVAELERSELDGLGVLTHAARRLGVERSEHTLQSIIGLLEARVAELEPIFSKVCALLADNGPCDNIDEDSEDVHCGDDDCHYCELNRLASSVGDAAPTPNTGEPAEQREGEE